MSNQGATYDDHESTQRRVPYQQAATESQDSTTRERPARYRRRSLISPSPRENPRSPTSGDFFVAVQSRAEGLATLSIQHQRPRTLVIEPVSAGPPDRQTQVHSDLEYRSRFQSTQNTTAPPVPIRGHRRSKATVSQLSDIMPRNSPPSDPVHVANTIRVVGQFDVKVSNSPPVLPAFSFDSPSVNLIRRKPVPSRAASSNRESIVNPRPTLDRTSSNDSTSTVASDSWNVLDPTTSTKKEVGVRFDFVQFDTPGGTGSQPNALATVSGLHSSTSPLVAADTRICKRFYPLDECVQASHKQGVQTFDFAYPTSAPAPKKHVQFASHSDHAPSVHYLSSSEDLTPVQIDSGEHKLSEVRATLQKHGKNVRRASLDLLRQTVDSMGYFTAAQAGMVPFQGGVHGNDGSGELDRGFQFPARSADPGNSSMPDVRAAGGENANGHKRRNSFGRLLHGLCGGRTVD